MAKSLDAADLIPLDLKDEVIHYILKRILSGDADYKPGAFLTEAGVAREVTKALGRDKTPVSRVPVREAFLELENARFLVIYPQAGTKIRKLEDEDIADLLRSRQFLEERVAAELIRRQERAARKLNRRPEQTLAPARAVNDQLRAIARRAQQGDETPELRAEFVRTDSEFHAQLAQTADLDEFAQTLRRIRQQLLLASEAMPTVYAPSMESVVEEHDAILDSIQSGDLDRAVGEVREHIANSARRWNFYAKVEAKLPELFREHTPCPAGAVADMVGIRAFIETQVARDLAGRPKRLTEAMEFLVEMEKVRARAVERDDPAEEMDAFTAHDLRFHLALVQASQYEFLLEPLRHIWHQMFPYAKFPPEVADPAEHMQKVIEEHNKILNAIALAQFAKNPEEKGKWLKELEEAVLSHIRFAFERWKEYKPRELAGYELKPFPITLLRAEKAAG